MGFIEKLRDLIRQYESYVDDFPENKLIFRLMLAELRVLENEYFRCKEIEDTNKEIEDTNKEVKE